MKTKVKIYREKWNDDVNACFIKKGNKTYMLGEWSGRTWHDCCEIKSNKITEVNLTIHPIVIDDEGDKILYDIEIIKG